MFFVMLSVLFLFYQAAYCRLGSVACSSPEICFPLVGSCTLYCASLLAGVAHPPAVSFRRLIIIQLLPVHHMMNFEQQQCLGVSSMWLLKLLWVCVHCSLAED